MIIKDFIKTDAGMKFSEALKGCDRRWQVEHWDNIEEYIECLADNNWSVDDIQDQIINIKLSGDVYWIGEEFAVIIN